MINLIIILSGFLVACYFYAIRNYKYWEKRGVKCEKAIPLFGNMAPYIFGKKSTGEVIEELYWKYPKEKTVGYFHFSRPVLIIRDPDIFQPILTTDFNNFYARGFKDAGQDYDQLETLMKNLLIVEGDAWRLMRNGLSPAFTSSKLKGMFPLLAAGAEVMRKRLRKLCEGARPIDVLDVMSRYNIDFIGTYAFGIDANTQNQENSYFRKLAKNMITIDTKRIIALFLKTVYPSIFKGLKHYGHVEKECCDLVNKVLRQRDYKSTNRHDFINMLLDIRAKGSIECESLEKINPDGTPKRVSLEFDDAVIAAQAFLFFAAGFETSSTSSGYTLHQLAYHPEEQKKIQAQIDSVLAKHDGKLTYDSINEMDLLERAFKEGLRMYPPGSHLMRVCRRKCTLQDSGVTVDEGIRVVISLTALHRDPKYWDSPEEFRPDRFSPESTEPRHKFAYLPFGTGPRGCIAVRLGVMQSLTAMVAILSRFSVSPAPNSVPRPVPTPSSNLVQSVSGGLPLIFTPRTQ